MRAVRFHNNIPRIIAAKLLGPLYAPAYCGPLSPLGLDEIDEPTIPNENWVKVRMRLAGICGSDLKQVLLKGAIDNPLTSVISFPHVLGHEVVGNIESVGSAVQGLKVGQRVLIDPWLPCGPRGISPQCSACQTGDSTLCRNFEIGGLPPGIHLGNNVAAPGAFADCFVAHESQCHVISEGISDEAAVLADPFAVSLHSVLRAPPPANMPALVYGLGPLGLMAIAALRKLYPRIEILAVGRHAHQTKLALEFGAKEVIVGRRNQIIERVAELTKAYVHRPWSKVPWLMDGVGVVYDTVGSPESVETSLRVVQSRGTIVVSGVEIPKRFEWTPLYFKEVAVMGSNAFAMETVDNERIHAMDLYLRWVSQGLDLTQIITHRFPLSSWREGFTTLMSRGTSGAVKVVLTPTSRAVA